MIRRREENSKKNAKVFQNLVARADDEFYEIYVL